MRPVYCYYQLAQILFQSTHPNAGCDNIMNSSTYKYVIFQSTHPNAGCDTLAWLLLVVRDISIHASQRGMRLIQDHTHFSLLNISIHASQRGMRLVVSFTTPLSSLFQSTHPNAGCDSSITGLGLVAVNFNPRIPTRDATLDK